MLSSATSLREAFARYLDPARVGVIGYVMGGIEGPGGTVDVGEALLQAGVCVLEVGMPFSDPTADGPTIMRQAERALSGGSTLDRCLDHASQLAGRGTPIVTMGYANSVYSYGIERYAATLQSGNIEGTIIADAPVDEQLGIRAALEAHHVAFVPLATPTSTDSRLGQIAQAAGDSGFIYCVARRGVTGSRQHTGQQDRAFQETVQLVERTRAAAPDVPRAVGFGISTPAHVQALAPHTEAVVVASAMFDHISGLPLRDQAAAAGEFMSNLVTAGA